MSKRNLGLTLLFALAVAGPARADMGTPGMKYPKITHNISSESELTDHLIIVVRHRLYFAEKNEPERTAEFVKLPFDVTARHRRESVDIVIVPKSLANEFPVPLELAEAAKSRRSTERFELRFDEEVPAWYGESFTINSKLVMHDGGRIELVRTSWRPFRQCCVVLVAIPLAIVWLGFVAIRRLLRTTRAAPRDQ